MRVLLDVDGAQASAVGIWLCTALGGNPGFNLRVTAAGEIRALVEGNTALTLSSGVTASVGERRLMLLAVDRDGDADLYIDDDSTAKASGACPAGSHDSGDGLGLNARPDGTGDLANVIYRAQIFHTSDVTTYDIGDLQQLVLDGRGF